MTLTVNLFFICIGFAVFTDCRPQDVFSFPGESEGTRPPRIPNQTNRLTTRRPSQNMITQIPITESTSQAADDGVTTTRVPPRDPTNRIVYLVSCPCQFTYQYNPVCGTDGQTYGNMGVIQCARRCGTDVDVFLVGACGRNNG